MNQLRVAQADLTDCAVLAPRLRQADLDEIAAATGQTAYEALAEGWMLSPDCRAILTDSGPIAVLGVVPHGPDVGAPWLLGSDGILDHWREFARRSDEVLADIRRPWPRLANHVYAANHLHVRWLRWLGARLTGPEPFGVAGLPFWKFTL